MQAKTVKKKKQKDPKKFHRETVFEGTFGTKDNITKVRVTSVKKGWRRVHIKQRGHKEIVINVRPKKINDILIDERFKTKRARAGGIYHELDNKILDTYKMMRRLEGVSKANAKNDLAGGEFDEMVKKALSSKDPEQIEKVYNLIFKMRIYDLEYIFDYKKDVTGQDVTDMLVEDQTAFTYHDTGSSRTVTKGTTAFVYNDGGDSTISR